jgi:hypothetical protein
LAGGGGVLIAHEDNLGGRQKDVNPD